MLARQHSSAWEVFAPAKLNLYLEVLGRRRDAYHELLTLMAPVRIFDRLRWTPGASYCFECHPAGERAAVDAMSTAVENLVVRAVQRLAKAARIEPYGRFELWKTIPVGAGLGGGSSDAAAALVAANAAWGLGYSRARLASIAAELGSDVPFFLYGGPAICSGRGETVQPVRGLPRLDVVVVQPPEQASTAVVFGQLNATAVESGRVQQSQKTLSALIAALRCGRLAKASAAMTNSLQASAARFVDSIQRVLDAFARCDIDGCFLTGSGSACVAVCRSAQHARHVAGEIRNWTLGKVWATSTCH